jgi:hypothetical protein
MNADCRPGKREVMSTALELRSLLPLLAAVTVLLGGVYLLYARARIDDAIAAASRRAGLSVRYRAESSWRPGRVRLRDLVIASASDGWSLRFERIDVALFPVLGGPRSIQLELPDQSVQLRTANFEWTSRLRAGAELSGLTELGPNLVRRAAFGLRDGVLRSPASALRAVNADVILTSAGPSPTEPLLRGTVSLQGGSGAEMLALLGADAAARRFPPDALREPFEIRAQVSLTPAHVKLDALAFTCGEVSLEGGLDLRSTGRTGALQLKTAARDVGGAIHELDPAVAWF